MATQTQKNGTQKNGTSKGAPAIPAGTAMFGGEASEGFTLPPEGEIFRGEIVEAEVTQNEGKNPQLFFKVEVRKDSEHPDWEGKKLFQKYQSLVASTPEKQKNMNGMIKRLVEALGMPWPKEAKPLNAKLFIGKSAYWRVSHEPGTGKNEGKTYSSYDRVGKTREDAQ